jgi:hypothetical protein
MGAMLLNHLSPPNAARFDVVIRGEAVVRGGRFYLRNHFDIPNLNGDSYRLSVSSPKVPHAQALRLFHHPAHTLFFIAEAADDTGLRLFLTPLREAGEVEVLAASTYAEVNADDARRTEA